MKLKNHFFWLFVFCLLLLIPVMIITPQLGHDTGFHLKNIELLAKHFSFSSPSSFFILPEAANHLGYGIGIFYPMLPHLIAAFFCKLLSIFSIPTIYSVYLVYFLVLYGASLIVYKLAKKIHNHDIVAFFSACIYVMMPYVLGDLFVRMAYNEVFLFFFFPCVVLGLVSLVEENHKEFYLYFVIGCIGMISSHLVLTMFAAILLLPCLLIYSKSIFGKENRKVLFLAIGTILLFVLPNIMLLLKHYISKNYLVNLEGYMTSLELIQDNTLEMNEFFVPYNNYDWSVAFFIPVGFWLLFLFSCILCFKNRKKQHIPYFYSFFFLIVLLIFMISKLFPYEFVLDLFYMIQFPWRLFTFFILPFSLLTPLCFLFIKENKIQKNCVITFLIVLFLIQIPFYHKLMNRPYPLKQYYQESEVNLAMGHSYEYLPVMSLDRFEERKSEIKLLDGSGTFEIIKNEGTLFEFRLQDIQKSITIELPKLYYYGYEITNEDGKVLLPTMSKEGYIQVTLQENGVYKLSYVGTKIYRILSKIRMFGLFSLLLFFLVYFRKRKGKL